jgi:hypothetical protein
VVDFEAALWKALREVFQGAEIHGCCFHWSQAVWRKVQVIVTKIQSKVFIKIKKLLLLLLYNNINIQKYTNMIFFTIDIDIHDHIKNINILLQDKGLATEYKKRRGAHKFIRKLLCLPFLPAEHIAPVFDDMEDIAPDRYTGLMRYIRRTWLTNPLWPVECWSVYGMSVRTNNDVEGNFHKMTNTAK